MTVGFIGGGNMANAIISGIVSSGLYKPNEIYVTDVNEEALKKYEKNGINTDTKISCAISADIVIFAVKPFILPNVLSELKEKYAQDIKNKIFATIVAGVSIEKIKNALGFNAKIIRVMPNTPALVLSAMCVLASEYAPATEEEFLNVRKIFEAVGKTEVVSENLMSAVTAVSGSGPAYVYMMIEAMADAGVRGGLSRNAATALAAQTVLGSAKMVLDTKKHPGELKDMVCSPKGTTIEAVAELEKSGFRGALISAIEKCFEKAENI